MAKRKLERFAALNTFSNVVQNFNFFNPQLINFKNEKINLKGKWSEVHFANNNPISIELACGKGEYTVDMATARPDKNFIGIDIKGNRMFIGAKKALDEHILNAAFLRTDINLIEKFFAKNEVNEIWITFPDPYLKQAKSNKRLTSVWFLNKYKNILAPGGIMHLKTDDTSLYEFTLETIANNNLKLIYASDNIYSGELPYPFLSIKTYYEKIHLALGKKIKYIQFRFE